MGCAPGFILRCFIRTVAGAVCLPLIQEAKFSFQGNHFLASRFRAASTPFIFSAGTFSVKEKQPFEAEN